MLILGPRMETIGKRPLRRCRNRDGAGGARVWYSAGKYRIINMLRFCFQNLMEMTERSRNIFSELRVYSGFRVLPL